MLPRFSARWHQRQCGFTHKFGVVNLVRLAVEPVADFGLTAMAREVEAYAAKRVLYVTVTRLTKQE